jgi:hypothetical protein
MISRAMKTTAPTIAPTIPAMGIVVEDDGEELLEEAAGGGVVILIPISFTQKLSAAAPGVVGSVVIVVVDIVRFIWRAIYPIVGSEPCTTDVEPLCEILEANEVL